MSMSASILLAAVCGFIAGRLWYGEREVRVRTELDPDLVWKTLKKTAETMDRSTWGTTEEMMLPSMSRGATSKRLSMVLSSAQYWSAVLTRSVAMRASKRIRLSSMQPRTMLLLPMSMAKIITRTSYIR